MTKTCRECGSPHQPKRTSAAFCSRACRQSWNNRRAMRGAQLYDLFMTQRYERSLAKKLGVWSIMCRLALKWKTDDDDADRKSYGSASQFIADNPWLKVENLGTTLGNKRMPSQPHYVQTK
jgi:hypothetical protein